MIFLIFSQKLKFMKTKIENDKDDNHDKTDEIWNECVKKLIEMNERNDQNLVVLHEQGGKLFLD